MVVHLNTQGQCFQKGSGKKGLQESTWEKFLRIFLEKCFEKSSAEKFRASELGKSTPVSEVRRSVVDRCRRLVFSRERNLINGSKHQIVVAGSVFFFKIGT